MDYVCIKCVCKPGMRKTTIHIYIFFSLSINLLHYTSMVQIKHRLIKKELNDVSNKLLLSYWIFWSFRINILTLIKHGRMLVRLFQWQIAHLRHGNRINEITRRNTMINVFKVKSTYQVPIIASHSNSSISGVNRKYIVLFDRSIAFVAFWLWLYEMLRICFSVNP